VGLGYSKRGKKKRKSCQKKPLGTKTRCEKKTKKTTLKKGPVFIQGAIIFSFWFFLLKNSFLSFILPLSLATTRIDNNNEELLLVAMVLVAPNFQPFLCHQQPNKGAHAWEGDFLSIWRQFHP
jgi:hypothetical protein